jgi:hypothetical protein
VPIPLNAPVISTTRSTNRFREASSLRPPSLASPLPLDALGEGYTNRFINLRDGADDAMSLRWGEIGPKRRSSSGLN